MNEDLMGRRIKMKRTELGLTMEMLGDILGVGKSAVNKWEKGKVKNIKRSTIAQMAQLFEVSPVWLMGLDNDTAYYDVSIPTLEDIPHIEVETPTLTQEERELIQKYRVDVKFRNVVKALNGYDETIPVLKAPPIPKVSNEIPTLKKVAKIKRRKDELA